jgi:hypothetical protein
VVVSQYLNHRQLRTAPSQNRTCAVNASGSPPALTRVRTLSATQVSTADPTQCPERAQIDQPAGSAAFPPLALPSFEAPALRVAGPVLCGLRTSQCRLRSWPLQLVHAYSSRRNWHSRRSRAVGISLVALLTWCVTRMGLRVRAFPRHSPCRDTGCCLPVWTDLGQVPTGTTLSELNTVHAWTASPVHSSSLPFCVRFNVPVASHAATLDTGPVANGYPGGSRSRWSTNHFQFALATSCYLAELGCSGCDRMPYRGPAESKISRAEGL